MKYFAPLGPSPQLHRDVPEGLRAQDMAIAAVRRRGSCRCNNLCNEPHQHGVRACKLNSRSVPLLLSLASRTLLSFKMSFFLASLISCVALVLVSLSLCIKFLPADMNFFNWHCQCTDYRAGVSLLRVWWQWKRVTCHLENTFPKTLLCPHLLCQSKTAWGLGIWVDSTSNPTANKEHLPSPSAAQQTSRVSTSWNF